MTRPIAICLEDVAGDRPRYLRCTAVQGGQPGLTLAPDGAARWHDEEPALCELYVSADGRLVLLRGEAAPGVRVIVRRSGRWVEAPEGKPVFVLDGDELEAGGRTLRLHVHGPAAQVAAPSPLPEREAPARLGGVAGVAAALGAGVASILVSCHPPKASPRPTGLPTEDRGPTTSEPTTTPPDAGPPADADVPPIEIRETPPAPMPIDEPG